MVKFNSLFTLFGLICLSAFVLGDDCLQLSRSMKKYNIQLKTCKLEEDKKSIHSVVLRGESVNQSVIDAIAKFDNIDYLTFEQFKEFSENLNLKHLKVRCFEIVDIPINSTYETLKNEHVFRAYSIPKGFLKSLNSNVEGLHISGFYINQRTIDEISTLKNIRYVNLFDNGFERGLNVNKFKNLKKLEHLYFGDFEVTNPEKLHSFDGFSDAFCEFRNLKSLNIKHSNIRRIPDCIKNLKKLVEIRIVDDKIYRIPSAISELPNLQAIYLYNNQIKEIPRHMTELKKLYYLDLSNNLISSLPEYIKQMECSIYLKNNKINAVPDYLKNVDHYLKIEI